MKSNRCILRSLREQSVVRQKRDRVVDLRSGWLAAWLTVIVLVAVWRAQSLAALGTTNDEGAYLMWAKLPLEGYPLYRDTQAVQPPLFFELIGLALRLGGHTIEAGRWAVLLSFIGLLTVTSGLAYQANRWLGALVAVVILALSPLLFAVSGLVLAEVPATTLAAGSLACAILFWKRDRRSWLFGSGVFLALSLLVKAGNPFMLAPIGLLVLARRCSWSGSPVGLVGVNVWDRLERRQLLIDGLSWLAGFALPLLWALASYDTPAMIRQVILFRGDLRAAVPGSWTETGAHFYTFITTHGGLGLLALAGVLAGTRNGSGTRRSRPDDSLLVWVWLVWLLSALSLLLWHSPLFYHHLTVMIPPLALLGAHGVTSLVPSEGTKLPQRLLGRLGLVLVLVLAAALNLPAAIEANQTTVSVVTGGREKEALSLLQAVSGPGDFLMGDSQLLIFMAGRRTPPPLGDVALVAIKAGWQTSSKLTTLTQQYRSPAVVQWALRLPWLPDYLAWVKQNYLAHRVWDNDHVIYFVRRFAPGEAPPNEQHIRLGESMVLRGYQLSEPVEAGQALNLRIFWETQTPIDRDYTVFVQLLDEKGALVVSRDSQPLGGYFPTTDWPTGEIVTDVVTLPLPADLAPGRYQLITGMYWLGTLERLPASSGEDFITLTMLEVGSTK